MDKFKQQLKDAYDTDAKRRDSAEGKRDQWKLDLRENFVNLLKKENKKTILELGSGAGLDAKYFQDNGFDILATDLSGEMINMCKKRGLNAQVIDLYDLSALNRKFDGIYSLNVLLHVPKKDLKVVLNGISNIIKPKGIFFYGVYGGIDIEEVITDKSKMNLPRLFSFLSDKTLLEIIKEKFEVISFEIVDIGSKRPGFHFQSLLLRKK
jgi:cyclopropane fatty-acyl-phospholipid synthase-like methyltransferase